MAPITSPRGRSRGRRIAMGDAPGEAALRLVGAVPAFRKWNERPGRLVVCGFRGLIEGRRVGQEFLPQGTVDRHSHGIQQSVEFNFRYRALQIRERGDLDCAHRNCPQNDRHAIAIYDCAFFIAGKGREKGPSVSTLFVVVCHRRTSVHQDARDRSLIGGDYGQADWQTDRDLADSGADGFAARSPAARDRSATRYE